MDGNNSNPQSALSADTRVTIAAYHEAGHIAIAAVQGLRLREEGVMVDTEAQGLACYCKTPEDSDTSRERVILSTFAGCLAQERFCEEHSYPLLSYLQIIWSQDWKEAREIEIKLSDKCLSGRGMGAVQETLEQRSKQIVSENWPAIKLIATALCTKDWEPVKPLKSGDQWAKGDAARYLSGEEIVRILRQVGINAVSVAGC